MPPPMFERQLKYDEGPPSCFALYGNYVLTLHSKFLTLRNCLDLEYQKKYDVSEKVNTAEVYKILFFQENPKENGNDFIIILVEN